MSSSTARSLSLVLLTEWVPTQETYYYCTGHDTVVVVAESIVPVDRYGNCLDTDNTRTQSGAVTGRRRCGWCWCGDGRRMMWQCQSQRRRDARRCCARYG